MNRGYTVAEYTEFLDRARAFLDQPEIGRPLMLSGDFIVGFPTETDEDFEATIALVERARYKSAFIFKYSPRPGTVAIEKLADDVPEAVKRSRNNRLLLAQARISEEIGATLLGTTPQVFVEGLSAKERKRRDRAQPASSAPKLPGGVSLTIAGRAASNHAVADTSEEACCSTKPREADADTLPEQVQLSGRTDGDVIVHFDAPPGRSPESMLGTIVPVRITQVRALSVLGTVASA
jgi:tRNA-2-methylthio-N6-dimethylallyladenosine synthase